MPLLEKIRVFTRAVELESLSAAGRNMRLSPGVFSQRIGSLERHLGRRLINRSTRKMQLRAALDLEHAFRSSGLGHVVAAGGRCKAARDNATAILQRNGAFTSERQVWQIMEAGMK